MKKVSVSGSVLAALLIAAPAAASHNFDDVPSSHPHHAGVDWVSQQGITSGCGGGSYCPNESVTRGQMATFLHSYDQQQETESSPPTVEVVKGYMYAECPSGSTLIGGGFHGDREVPVWASFPNGNRWQIYSDAGVTAYAVCMR